MPLSKEHKIRTRARIITAASRLFRRHGYDAVSIDRIMAAAGLTRGGFYAHFSSKADLLAAVVAGPHWFNRRLAARKGRTGQVLRREALALIGEYLHPDHTQAVAENCPLVSLSRDVAASTPKARKALTDAVRHIVDEFARQQPAGPAPRLRPADPRALAALAVCVGGVTLARTADDPAFAKAILSASRAAAGTLIGGRAAGRKKSGAIK